MKTINANSEKRNKVKDFSISLTCTILSRSEFDLVSRYYNFVSSSCKPRKVDMLYNCRSFYQKGSYNSLKFLYSNFTFEEYISLPRFICVECVRF